MKNRVKSEVRPHERYESFADELKHFGIEEESFWKGWEVATFAIPPDSKGDVIRRAQTSQSETKRCDRHALYQSSLDGRSFNV